MCVLVDKKQLEEQLHNENSSNSLPDQDTLRAKLYRCAKNRNFWYLLISFMICGISTTGFLETHIIAYVVDRGLSKDIGALAFGVLSAFNGLGILLAGYLSDRYSRPMILCVIFLSAHAVTL